MSGSSHCPSQMFILLEQGIEERRDLNMDGFEETFLSVARHIFENYAAPEEHCWMDAFMEAERAFPPPFGASIAHAIAMVIETMRSTRSSTFSFLRNSDAASDRAITREERYLVQTVQFMRKGQTAQALTQSLLLCDGHSSRKLLGAIERLCLITGDVTQTRFQNV